MKLHTTLKSLFASVSLLVVMQSSHAQKDNFTKKQKDQVDAPKCMITPDMDEQVKRLVQPVKEAVEKIIRNDQSGTFDRYAEDVKKIRDMKNNSMRSKMTEELKQKYFSFFKKIWAEANIDENMYQRKIRDIYPAQLRETIRFSEFLNYTMSASPSQSKPDLGPAPPPANTNICIDANVNTFAITSVSPSLIAKGTAIAGPGLIVTDAVAEVAGLNQSQATLLSNISIPGTFPSDNKVLRITKSYMWRSVATAVAVIGFSFSSMSNSTDNFGTVDYFRAYAPVIWVSSITKTLAKNEVTLVQKRFMMNIRFGIQTYADSFAEIIAVSFADSQADTIHWNICEE